MPIDCKVSLLSEWSNCNRKFGKGKQYRQRSILIKPRFGGIICPRSLKAERTCFVKSYQKNKYSLKMASIISAKLLFQKEQMNSNNPYFVLFKILYINSNCKQFSWGYNLQKNNMICVKCQIPAQSLKSGKCIGDGIKNHITTWQMAMATKCNGKWIAIRKTKLKCKGVSQDLNYVFI